MSDNLENWDMTKYPEFMERLKQDQLVVAQRYANDPEHQRQKRANEAYNALLSTAYRIVCFRNGRVYVGITVDFEKRRSQHLSNLRGGKHNREIQKDYNEFGEDAFYFEILEKDIPRKKRNQVEDKWMRFYKSYDVGYNIEYFDDRGMLAHKIYPRPTLFGRPILEGQSLSDLIGNLATLINATRD